MDVVGWIGIIGVAWFVLSCGLGLLVGQVIRSSDARRVECEAEVLPASKPDGPRRGESSMDGWGAVAPSTPAPPGAGYPVWLNP